MNRLAIFLASLALACATVQPDATQAVVAAASTLSALERGMAAYCRTPTHDVDVCASARLVDRDAYAAVTAARAVVEAGGDPEASIAAANLALSKLAEVLANHGVKP